MGNDDGQPAEGPAHKVRMSPYYIDQHEVTVRQFRLFLAETHYRGKPASYRQWSEDFRQNPSESLPMVMVNARDAQAYADWALKKLPTEAQWEMAARSTDGRLYPLGIRAVQARHARGSLAGRAGHGRARPTSLPTASSTWGETSWNGPRTGMTPSTTASFRSRASTTRPVRPPSPGRSSWWSREIGRPAAPRAGRGSCSRSGWPTSASAASCPWSSRRRRHRGPRGSRAGSAAAGSSRATAGDEPEAGREDQEPPPPF